MTLFGKGKKLFIDVYVATQKLNHKWTKRMRDKTNGKVSRKEMKIYK